MNNSEFNKGSSSVEETNSIITSNAWRRLQEQLTQEPVNPQWTRLSKQLDEKNQPMTNSVTMEVVEKVEASNSHLSTIDSDQSDFRITVLTIADVPNRRTWIKRNRKWVGSVAAVGLITVALAIPIGNQALANILNQFRMQQVTVVQEEDVKQIFNQAMDGQARDAINKFGAFTHVSGTVNGQFTVIEAETMLNHKLVIPKEFDQTTKINIIASNEITLNLHVAEVNKALQRLGSTKLLPLSIDGKSIKFSLCEGVRLNMVTNTNGEMRKYTLFQMPVPLVIVDPSIPVAEAIDAIINLPLLPDNLKSSLKQTRLLNGGNVPLPLIVGSAAEKHMIKGTDVILTMPDKATSQRNNYSLTWVNNGQLFMLYGDLFATKEAALAKVAELIL